PEDGKALFSYTGSKRDEALSDIATEVYKQLQSPAGSPQSKILTPDRTIEVKKADALTFTCDVLVLKYAQGWHGVDAMVMQRLKGRPQEDSEISPAPGKFVLLSSKGQVTAQNILFVGVP